MSIADMHEWFDILQDKYQSPYFTDVEKDVFLNRAQLDLVNGFFPDAEGKEANIELNSHILENLSPLIFSLDSLTMDSSGVVLDTAVQAALDLKSGSNEPLMYILNVSNSDNLPVKFVRHNDYFRFQQNTFKKGNSNNPQYRRFGDEIVITPIDITKSISLTVFKLPRDMQFTTNRDSELSESMHNNIVATAINLAGIATREEALVSLNQIHKDV